MDPKDIKEKINSYYTNYEEAINYLRENISNGSIDFPTFDFGIAYLKTKLSKIKLGSQQRKKKKSLNLLNILYQEQLSIYTAPRK